MKKEAGVEYRLLLSVSGGTKIPDPLFLEVFSYQCESPWFRTEEFRRLLIDYRLVQYPKMLEERRKEKKRRARKRKRLMRDKSITNVNL